MKKLAFTLLGGLVGYPSLRPLIQEQDFFGYLAFGTGLGTLLGLFLTHYLKTGDFAGFIKRVWPPLVGLAACVVLYLVYVIFYVHTTGPTSSARGIWIGLDVLLLSMLWSTVTATLGGQAGGKSGGGPPTP